MEASGQTPIIQIAHIDCNEKLMTSCEDLENILLAGNIKDREVSIISIAGAYRGGKSFMLNFFLRYLYSRVSVSFKNT